MGTWITDAQFAGPISPHDIHQTQDIRKFLKRDNEMHFILVASKGMGKTLLMRLKREQLQAMGSGVTIVPHNSETDYVSLPSSPEKNLATSLEDQAYWTALWQTSIMVSVILNSKLSAEVVGRQRMAKEIETYGLPPEIAQDLDEALGEGSISRRKPSEILDTLLQQSKGRFERFRQTGLAKLTFVFRDVISSACAVFIDSLDQELETKFPQNLEIWRTGQLGLMRAAWELNRINSHVKVFVTIRQEAFASFTDPIKSNLAGSAIIIKYSDEDLRKILEVVIRTNDGPYTIDQFFGFKEIYNHYIDSQEEIFSYLKRHTIGVPRWLVSLGYEISRIRDGRDLITDDAHLRQHQRAVAETVNTQSAALARDYVETEMRLFFKSDDPISELKLLFQNVQSTVLSLANLNRLNERYQDSSASPISHPFCLLVNIGLLGHTDKSVASPWITQRFRMPFEFDWHHEHILSKNPDAVFFLHPSMHQMAQDSNDHFHYFGIKIGNRLAWTAADEERMREKRFSVFISYASRDWDAGVAALVTGLENYFSETGEFVDIWIDRNKMVGARKYVAQLSEGNRDSDYMVFFASHISVKSRAVLDELAYRKDLDIRQGRESLFTVIIDDISIGELPLDLSADHILFAKGPTFSMARLGKQLVQKCHRERRAAPA